MKWATAGRSCLVLAGVLLAATGSAVDQLVGGVPTGATNGTPEQQAAADAKAILASFVVPPDAVRLAGLPTQLRYGAPSAGLIAATQEDVAGYWEVSGQPTALLAWEDTHVSRSYSGQHVIIGPPSWNTMYTLPPVFGVLPLRDLNVQVYDAGGGKTIIMAEAMVAYSPPRPAAEVVPASVRVVTIAPSGPGTQVPVTISSVSVVRQLAALVNSLPAAVTPGQNMSMACPLGAGFTLTFSATADGDPVAIADGPDKYGGVNFTLNGQDEPALQAPGSYDAAVLKVADLHW